MIFSKKIIIESAGDEEDAEKRRINNEWSLGPNCPEVGLQAHALYEFLISSGEVDEDNFDVYNLIPEGDEYSMRIFGIINSDIDDRKYLVGDSEDTKYAAIKSAEDLLEDTGIDHFKNSDLEDHLDMKGIISYFEDVISDDAWNYPEGYLEDSDKMLSSDQKNIIELKELKVQKLKSFIESIEEKNTDKSRIKNKVEELKGGTFNNEELITVNESVESKISFLDLIFPSRMPFESAAISSILLQPGHSSPAYSSLYTN